MTILSVAFGVVAYLLAGVLWTSLAAMLATKAKKPFTLTRATLGIVLWPVDLVILLILLVFIILCLPLIALGALAKKLGGGK